jgi:hypothetical protein
MILSTRTLKILGKRGRIPGDSVLQMYLKENRFCPQLLASLSYVEGMFGGDNELTLGTVQHPEIWRHTESRGSGCRRRRSCTRSESGEWDRRGAMVRRLLPLVPIQLILPG